MRVPFTPLAAVLAAVGLLDLIMVPVMVSAHSQPPMAATIGSGVIGAVTLAGIPGLAQGRRWAFWALLVSRIIDALSSALGAAGGPEAIFKLAGALALVLSVAAIIMLVRFGRRRAVSAA
jgi:hypothetical protein